MLFRSSPEAPVPVVEVVREEDRHGGAGNVIYNLTSLGAKVTAAGDASRVGVVGTASAGGTMPRVSRGLAITKNE